MNSTCPAGILVCGGMTLYFKNEMLLRLERTGFADVAVRSGYTDAEPTGEDDFLLFIATK